MNIDIGNIKFKEIKTEVPLGSAETNHQYIDVDNGESVIQPIADNDNKKTSIRRLIKSSAKSQIHKMSRSHHIEEYNGNNISPSLTVLPSIENDDFPQHKVFVSGDDMKQEQISVNQESNQLHDNKFCIINRSTPTVHPNIANHENGDNTKQDHISDTQESKQLDDITTFGIINSPSPTVLLKNRKILNY